VKRYKEKLDTIQKRIGQISEWTKKHNKSSFTVDELVKLATYKAYQEAVEASMDIVAMLCKDSKISPKDDYSNIKALIDKGLLKNKIGDDLIDSNGLRNRLVHKYNKVDDDTAFVKILESLPGFERFIDVIEKWMKKKLRE